MMRDFTLQLGFWDLVLYHCLVVGIAGLAMIQFQPVAVHIVWCLRALRRRPTWRWLPMVVLIAVAAVDALSTEMVKAAHPHTAREVNPLFAHIVETGSAWMALLSSLPLLLGFGLLFLYRPARDVQTFASALWFVLIVAVVFRSGVVIHNFSLL
jgi:hypothetical protein